MDLSYYQGRRVLITGNTGFKGTWLSQILYMAGAEVTGYSLEPPTTPSLYEIIGMKNHVHTVIGDVRDFEKLQRVFNDIRPEVVFHLAAQPIVRESYKNPRMTYEINVMGTVNICECIRRSNFVHSFINVTTDKVYQNNEWEWGYRENDPLDGYDPYSNSKSCSELVTHSYVNSFLNDSGIAVSTARAGNVIGGGDFSIDRIIPDCIRAAEAKKPIIVRNAYSIRPYQHVLEPLMVYLMIASKQGEDASYSGNYNVGPEDEDCVTTGELVSMFCDSWGDDLVWRSQNDEGPHEAAFLKLDCSKLKKIFEWKPAWHIKEAIDKTVEWSKEYFAYIGSDKAEEAISEYMEKQIKEYLKIQRMQSKKGNCHAI